MVAGVPARIIGYMCERGERLAFNAGGKATTSYGQRYVKDPGGWVPRRKHEHWRRRSPSSICSPRSKPFGTSSTPPSSECLEVGHFILGPEEQAFEKEAAAFLGARHAVGLNSGTDALVIALRALGIGPGDEVITTPFTFFATAEAISQVGATPVFVDIEEGQLQPGPGSRGAGHHPPDQGHDTRAPLWPPL